MIKNIIQKVGKAALEYDKLSGCSQSVLLALQEAFNIGNTESFKSATALSGGIARRGETCGAIIGALMGISLLIGREKMEDLDRYHDAVKVGEEICDEFIKRLKKEFQLSKDLNNTICKDIQESIYGRAFYLADEKDYQAFIEAGGHSAEGCPKVCGIAAEVAAEKILQLTTKAPK
jgi:C_GCAxxG_C_C family probable redox protein